MKLLQPWILRHIKIGQLPRAKKLALQKYGVKKVLQVTGEANQTGKRKKQRCHICPSVIDCKTADCCSNCRKPCCTEHKSVAVICLYCTN